MPARGDIAEPAMPMIWMCLCELICLLGRNSALEKFQCARSLRCKSRVDSQWNSEHGPGGMADRRSKNHRQAERAKNSFADFFHGGTSCGRWFTVGKFSEHDALHGAKFSGL